MTGVVLCVAALTLAGLPLASRLRDGAGWRWILGVGFLTGSGMAAMLLLSASLVGLEWRPALVIGGLAAIALAAWLAAGRHSRECPSVPLEPNWTARLVDLVTLASLAGHAMLATAAPPWEWDYWAIWGLKAKEFAMRGGVSFEYLTRADMRFVHADYPLLLPLVYDVVAILAGGWDDRWLGMITVAFGAALLLVVREELALRCGSQTLAALGALALSGSACSIWIGLAEAPLVAFATAGLLVAARGIRDDSTLPLVAGGLLLGLSGITKNEGGSFVAAALVAALIAAPRSCVRLALPAGLVIAPWLAIRWWFGLTTDLFEGSFLARFTERLADPAAFLSEFAAVGLDRWELWAILAMVILARPSLLKSERFLVVSLLLQAAVYVAVFAGTVNELGYHLQTALARVSNQLAPLVGAIALIGIAQQLDAGRGRRFELEGDHEQEA